jgi:hypothetical protein
MTVYLIQFHVYQLQAGGARVPVSGSLEHVCCHWVGLLYSTRDRSFSMSVPTQHNTTQHNTTQHRNKLGSLRISQLLWRLLLLDSLHSGDSADCSWPWQRSAPRRADRSVFVTSNNYIPVNNTLVWRSVAFCACELSLFFLNLIFFWPCIII